MSHLRPLADAGYVLGERLGRGGSSTVFRALRQVDATDVAVKLMSVGDDHAAARLLQQYRRLAALDHANLVKILDVGRAGDTLYVVMPLAANGSLSGRLRDGSSWPSPRSAAEIVTHVAHGLQHLHDQGLVHLDVKPANVLLGDADRPLLADFGLSQLIGTAPVRVRGTPAYMSPEQCHLQGIGPASDQYALAVVSFLLLVGWLPFVGQTPRAILHQQVSRPPPPPREICPALPSRVERVLLIGLAKQAHERFASVNAFAFALDRAVGLGEWTQTPAANDALSADDTLQAVTLELPVAAT
jgi:eukaryotic-like serine/threonine-protein kinase